MKFITPLFLLAILLASCNERNPKITYDDRDTTTVTENIMHDSTKMLVAELPVKFDSTDILLFTIGFIDLNESGGYNKISSGSFNHIGSVSQANDDNITGNFINIIFQDQKGNERKLTDKTVKLRSANFLRQISRHTGQQYILYTLSDRDSNGDSKVDHQDVEALYISKLDGSDFKKISKELHEFYDYTLIKGESTIYFRTLEDINKDGNMDSKDKFHYYRIDFQGGIYSLAEYNPLRIFE